MQGRVLTYSLSRHDLAHIAHLSSKHNAQSTPKAEQSCSNSRFWFPPPPEPTVIAWDFSFLVIVGTKAEIIQEMITRVTMSSTNENAHLNIFLIDKFFIYYILFHEFTILNIEFQYLIQKIILFYVLNTVYILIKNHYSFFWRTIMNIKKDFGLRIKELRTKKGITQYQLAELAGIDPKHMSHIETGRSFPKADLIEKLAEAFNLEYTELFKTKHLQERQKKLENINAILKNLPDRDLNIIYKIISSYIN